MFVFVCYDDDYDEATFHGGMGTMRLYCFYFVFPSCSYVFVVCIKVNERG